MDLCNWDLCNCEECAGSGVVEDPTACGDPDHCSPWMGCRYCIEAGHNVYGLYCCEGPEE